MTPFWLVSDAPGIVARVTSDEEHQMSLTSILFYLLMSGLCAFFPVISLISTVSYSVANATKRIFVIVTSILTLRNPVKFANFIGMMVACFGVFNYNRVKRSVQKEANKRLVHTPFEKNALTI